MSSPLPLRLCCMAAMAPALTEAATQARIKLSGSPPPESSSTSSSPPTVVNGKDIGVGHQRHNGVNNADGRFSSDRSLPTKTALVSLAAHLQQPSQVLSHGLRKQVGSNAISSLQDSLQHLGVIQNLPAIYKQERLVSFPKQNGHHLLGEGKPGSIMNQPLPVKSQSKDASGETVNVVNGSQLVAQTTHVGHLKIENIVQGVLQFKQTSTGTKVLPNSLQNVNSENVDKSGPAKQLDECFEKQQTSCEDMCVQVDKMQHQLGRRTQFLLRRMNRLRGKHLEGHSRAQLSKFIEYQHTKLQTVAKSIRPVNNVTNADLKTELLQSEDVKSLSTAALVNLVRKLQSSQSGLSIGPRLVNSVPKTESHSVLSLDESTCVESERVGGQLSSNVHDMESMLDSDATESSSGGESCDEYDLDIERSKKVLPTPLHRRAEWKWAVDRSAVAARWTWLQAQVSDLEYRIRQQSDIYKQIRAGKGSVVLGDPVLPEDLSVRLRQARSGKRPSPLESKIATMEKKNEMSPCNISTLLINVDRQASKLTQSLGNCLSPFSGGPLNGDKFKGQATPKSLNGFVDPTHLKLHAGNKLDSESIGGIGPGGDGASSADMPESVTSPSVLDMTCHAARCRPVRSYRKRRLLRTAGVHQMSRKAARLSSVKCQCYPPETSCPMCGGRYNNTQTLDPDMMPLHERVSLLNPAFHPVLSFSQEIPLPVHFEALLKSGEWQNKPPPKSARALAAERRRQKLVAKDRRKATHKLTKSAAAVFLSSTKLRNKYERKTPKKRRGGSLPNTPKRKSAVERRLCRTDLKRRRAAQLAMAAFKRSNKSLSMSLPNRFGNRRASPHFKDGIFNYSASYPSAMLKEMREAAMKRRRGESAFDINNIVIPYSMAAATRVEKLQYKEIVTPKWRDITMPEDIQDPASPVTDAVPVKVEGAPIKTEEDLEKINTAVDEEEEEIEDISDELFLERHLKCEAQEKKRFLPQMQNSRRGRGARTESSNFTDPQSPDYNAVGESPAVMGPIPLPAVQNVNPPVTQASSPGIAMSMTTSAFYNQPVTSTPVREESSRLRSSSLSSIRRISVTAGDESSRDSLMEFEYSTVEPWPERTFPLEEEEYEKMKAILPPSSEMNVSTFLTPLSVIAHRADLPSPASSRPSSPRPSSSSGSIIDEDPNDPEWTVIDGDKTPHKISMVLKLTKR